MKIKKAILTLSGGFDSLYIQKTACASGKEEAVIFFVRTKGLEPPRLSAPDPKSGTATNYATSAFFELQIYDNF